MTRCYSEKEWSLYVEGDIAVSQAERMQTHLLGCAECSEVVDELHESQFAIKSLRQDAAPAAAHALVRERVLDEVARQASSGWTWRLERMLFGIRWRYAVCSVAIIAFMTAVLWQSNTPRDPAATIVSAPATTPPPLSAPIDRQVASEQPRREIRRVTAKAKPIDYRVSPKSEPKADLETAAPESDEPRPLMVKMLTDDPNVVIYWIVDQKGGSNESVF
jgi:hypothetical protein